MNRCTRLDGILHQRVHWQPLEPYRISRSKVKVTWVFSLFFSVRYFVLDCTWERAWAGSTPFQYLGHEMSILQDASLGHLKSGDCVYAWIRKSANFVNRPTSALQIDNVCGHSWSARTLNSRASLSSCLLSIMSEFSSNLPMLVSDSPASRNPLSRFFCLLLRPKHWFYSSLSLLYILCDRPYCGFLSVCIILSLYV